MRAAKGHDVDVMGLSYKAGDGYLAHAHGRSNQQAVFLSTLGRTYSLEAHTLPSARSQGEPLTGRFALGAGEEVRHLVMGNEGEPYLICSDAGYGFVCKYDDLIGKNKNGKALLTVPESSSDPVCGARSCLVILRPNLRRQKSNTREIMVVLLYTEKAANGTMPETMPGMAAAKRKKRRYLTADW